MELSSREPGVASPFRNECGPEQEQDIKGELTANDCELDSGKAKTRPPSVVVAEAGNRK
jgi:hypothetical protein